MDSIVGHGWIDQPASISSDHFIRNVVVIVRAECNIRKFNDNHSDLTASRAPCQTRATMLEPNHVMMG